ncbi:MAG: sporulation protein YunB [Clostridia bacterium]|nr:sporulation protein YunB [Clostridia bacterium]
MGVVPMLYRRRRRRPVYMDLHLRSLSRRARLLIALVAVLTAASAFVIQASMYLRELSCDIAVSNAQDLMILCINNTISNKFSEEEFDYDYFVTLERDNNGDVVAVYANMARINALSAEILQDVVKASNNGDLSIKIHAGNLSGISLLLGKGPLIPVNITALTSSHVDFENELISAGINQTKHQIKLDIIVDVYIVLPWHKATTQVVSELLIAETVIIGDVPETYFNMG